jgi:putative PEP-CTERM system TPR-repeat lipoprotein
MQFFGVKIDKGIAGILVLAACVSACNKTLSADELMAQARQFEQQHDHKAAIIQLKNVLQLDANNGAARLLLANIYNGSGDPVSAEKEARRAISLGIDQQQALPVLARSLIQQGKFELVLEETRAAHGPRPWPQVAIRRGQAYLALARLPEAQAQFEQALRLKPADAEATTGLAEVAAARRDMPEAMRLAALAVGTHPDNIDAWMFKGDLERSQGHDEAAAQAYDRAIALDPGIGAAHLQKAYMDIQARRFDAAKAELAAYRKVAPGNILQSYLHALLDYSQGNAAAALDSLQAVLKVAPEHLPTLLLAGAVQYKLGNLAQAEQHLNKYLQGDPANVNARKLLAATLLGVHRPRDALDVLAPALKAGQSDAYLLSLVAEANTQAGDFAKAADYLEKASALQPKAATLRTSLGLSWLGMGDEARAMNELTLATTLDASSLPAGLALVRTAIGLKRFDEALAAARNLARAQPDNPDVTTLIGNAYLGKGDGAAARAAFERALAQRPHYYPPVASLVQLDLNEKKPDAAKARLLAYLQQDRANADAMTALSGLAASRGQAAEATDWLEKASAANPDAMWPALRLATNYLNAGQADKGLTLARKLQTAFPGNLEVLDLLGQAQLANNSPADAVETYSQMSKIAPKSAQIAFRLAGAFMQTKNEGEARESLQKALLLAPDFLDAQLALADLSQRAGKIDEALALARQVEHQRAKQPVGFLLEGDLLLKQKKTAPALAAYEQALARSAEPAVKIKLVNVMQATGMGAEGERRLLGWIAEKPDDPGAIALRLYLSDVYIASGRYPLAAGQLQAVLQRQPGNISALNNLAWAYQNDKDSRALPTAEKAWSLAPDSAAVLDTLGWVLLEQGNTTRALPLLQKAASLATPATDIRYHYAYALFKSGDKAAARKELEQLLASGRRFPQMDGARSLLKQL